MKIIQEESIYEDGEKFHCITFDDDTYVCLTEDEYYDLLEIIENENQSDLNSFINNTHTRNSFNTSSGDMSNIGMFFSIVLGIIAIWVFNKTFQWIPIIFSILIFILGLLSLREGFTNHKKFHIIYALIYSICGMFGYLFGMFFLFIMISFTHLCFDSLQMDKIIEKSGLDKTGAISLILTVIGSFFYGAYYDCFDSK